MRSLSSTPEPAAAPEPCPNCGAIVADRFCGACGQERHTLRIPIRVLAGETLGELFSVDSRVGRTLLRLFFRPGAATRAYLDGKRASQTSPVKLYLATSFLFFLVSAVGPHELVVVSDGAQPAHEQKLEFSDAWLAQLRAGGPLSARVADRLEAAERESVESLRERIATGFRSHLPTAMFFLVPVLALLLRAFYPRTGIYLAEHGVFALHAHAVAFASLVPGAATGVEAVHTAGLAAAALHFVLALRRVYAQRWAVTVAKGLGIGLLYLLALGIALAAVFAVVFLA